MNKLVLSNILQVLCVGALIHPGVSVDKPPPKPPFEADFCSKCCREGVSVSYNGSMRDPYHSNQEAC